MPKQNNSITSTYYVHNQILQHLKTSKRSVPGPRKHFIISWVYKPKVPNTNLLEPRKQWSMKIFILKQNTREPLFHRPLASVRNSNLFSPRKHSR